jgi:CheY-like chemotaxis protein/phosphoribosyl 1,2-cyclic phosphodiesterase
VLGERLTASCVGPIRGHLLITHTHWDHIQGFPFFAPVFTPGNEFTIYGPSDGEQHLEQALSGQMQYRYFPVELHDISSSLHWRDLGEGAFQIEDLHVRTQYLNHPAITLGYRLEIGETAVAYCTDHEPFATTLFRDDAHDSSIRSIVHEGDRRHARFLAGADLVIHDAQYTEGEFAGKRTWGHSPITYVVDVCLAAGVKRLILFHHDPMHVDVMLDSIGAQARALVEQRGGRMEVSVASEGQVVSLDEGVPRASGSRTIPEIPSLPSRWRVLVVDDEPVIQDLVREILEGDECDVWLASDGEEALAQVTAVRPDLVLLDMRIPKLDGFGVLERLRRDARTADLPVIMLTGVSDAQSTERGFEIGVTDYMEKPFTPAQLRARVREWLQRSAQR